MQDQYREVDYISVYYQQRLEIEIKCTIYSSLKNMIYLEINLAKYAKD